jgi:hypothetical protein
MRLDKSKGYYFAAMRTLPPECGFEPPMLNRHMFSFRRHALARGQGNDAKIALSGDYLT